MKKDDLFPWETARKKTAPFIFPPSPHKETVEELIEKQTSCPHMVIDGRGHCEWCGKWVGDLPRQVGPPAPERAVFVLDAATLKARFEARFGDIPEPRADLPASVCFFCGLSSVLFDPGLDVHICLICGARETTTGWQSGSRQSDERHGWDSHVRR
jgi:hypothetical protein